MAEARTWKVRLAGHHYDLEDFPHWLDGCDFAVGQDDTGFFLTSGAFEEWDDPAEVRRSATEIVELLNGLGRLAWGEFQPIALGAAIERDRGDGTRRAMLVATETASTRAKAYAAVVSGGGVPQPDPNRGLLAPLLTLAQRTEPVQRALGFLSGPEVTWNDLYRAAEVVQEDVGGAMFTDGWVEKGRFDWFTGTAQSYSVLGRDARHGRDRHEPPSPPMTFGEARQVILGLVLAWIKWKAEQDATAPGAAPAQAG